MDVVVTRAEGPRTMEQILDRVDELKTWDVTGEREMELMRFVPEGLAAARGKHSGYRWDRGFHRTGASFELAPARVRYLIDHAVECAEAGTAEGRMEAKILLRRAEEVLWVVGADLDTLGRLRLGNEGSVRSLAGAFKGLLALLESR